MQTLYEKLKPELKQGIENNKDKYNFSCNLVITVLKSKSWYSELTIDEVRNVVTWSDYKGNLDWKFGDKLFNN